MQVAARELVDGYYPYIAALPALQVRAVGDRLDFDFRVDHEPRLDRRARRQMRKMLGIDFVETGEIARVFEGDADLDHARRASSRPRKGPRAICTIAASVCSSIEPRWVCAFCIARDLARDENEISGLDRRRERH